MPDAHFLLLSLRPAGEHGPLRKMAARHGGRVLALSPWRIVPRATDAARQALAAALACPACLFTSPAAVKAAAALQPLQSRPGQQLFAIGEGSRRALLRAGAAEVTAPQRMDSEGLLALPAIAALQPGTRFGLVTAPGGRGEIARQLQARGIHLQRADVYQRQPLPLRADAQARLANALAGPVPVYLALSSGEAFACLREGLPATLAAALARRAHVVAASPRLAGLATEAGFGLAAVAASARPEDLLAALQGARQTAKTRIHA